MIGGALRFDSYRDPAGFVFRENGRIYRAIRASYEPHYELLKSSGLAAQLIRDRLLVPFDEIDPSSFATSDIVRILAPREVPFLSYPWEWTFSQLKDAALATLSIQQQALTHGMTLKDGSSLNVQFIDGRPMLIDLLSFERYERGRPWVAYRQFCEQFLAPLVLASHLDERLLALTQVSGGSASLDLTVRLLGKRGFLQPGVFMHLHLQSAVQRMVGRRPAQRPFNHHTVNPIALKGLLTSLERTILRLKPAHSASAWTGYDPTSSGGQGYVDAKRALVTALIREIAPSRVWDIGCNNGGFSSIAAREGAMVVSLDQDHASVDRLYQSLRAEGETRILPLVVDIAFPTPGTGWMNREYRPFLDRGACDLCLALALVHHLAIGRNLPFRNIFELFRQRCTYLLIEYVPKDDPNVTIMLHGRSDVFDEYTRENFESTLCNSFLIVKRIPLENSGRILYLCRRKDSEIS